MTDENERRAYQGDQDVRERFGLSVANGLLGRHMLALNLRVVYPVNDVFGQVSSKLTEDEELIITAMSQGQDEFDSLRIVAAGSDIQAVLDTYRGGRGNIHLFGIPREEFELYQQRQGSWSVPTEEISGS